MYGQKRTLRVADALLFLPAVQSVLFRGHTSLFSFLQPPALHMSSSITWQSLIGAGRCSLSGGTTTIASSSGTTRGSRFKSGRSGLDWSGSVAGWSSLRAMAPGMMSGTHVNPTEPTKIRNLSSNGLQSLLSKGPLWVENRLYRQAVDRTKCRRRNVMPLASLL